MPRGIKRNPADVANRDQQTSLAHINKLIGSIARSAVKLNESIHNAGVLCMEHANNFGDTGPAARLVDALPKSYRRALVIGWFGTFSPITIAKDAKNDRMKAHLRGKADANKGDEGFRDWQIEAAKATPFYAMPEAEREPDVPSYDDVHGKVVDFLARMAKRAEKIEDAGEKRRALDELKRLQADLPKAEKADEKKAA